MGAESRGRKKRGHERIRVSSVKGLHNLSEGGAYIATNQPKRLGCTLMFELKVGSKGKVFRAMAEVVRVLHKPNPKIGEPAGMGIKFIEMSEEDSKLLQECLLEYKQKTLR